MKTPKMKRCQSGSPVRDNRPPGRNKHPAKAVADRILRGPPGFPAPLVRLCRVSLPVGADSSLLERVSPVESTLVRRPPAYARPHAGV